MSSPYHNKPIEEWQAITDILIERHPLKTDEIVKIVLKSWGDIIKSKLGSFSIGKEIFPTPQIIAFFLHELVAHNLSLSHPEIYKVGTEKTEKDIHCITDNTLSIEIKASSNASQIFANRSYAQPQSSVGQKNKDGYYITINFRNFSKDEKIVPEILLIRFGYIEHCDWIAQASATGQQARLKPEAYLHKLKTIYPRQFKKK